MRNGLRYIIYGRVDSLIILFLEIGFERLESLQEIKLMGIIFYVEKELNK